MNYKSLLKNSAIALLAQAIILSVSIITTLGMPKVLGVTEFGYWQLFIFYTSYVGFFHLGLTDGVFLILGGTPRSKVDKRLLNSQFWFGLSYELFFSVVVIIFALTLNINSDRRIVLAATAIFIIINNASFFLGFMFQAMNETRLYSYSMIIDRLFFLLPLTILLGLRIDNFVYYILFYICSKTISLGYCLYHAKDFLCAGFEKLGMTIHSGLKTMSAGIKLTLANTASMLIVGICRYAVDDRWGIDVFSKISFSLSLVNFILFSVQQISMVMFPELRQADSTELVEAYKHIQNSIDLCAPLLYLLYYPALFFISAWLPQYADSMRFFAILFPICIFDAKMEMGCSTIFKVKRQETLLLVINAITVTMSLVVTILGTYMLSSLTISLIGIVCTVIARSLFSEWYLSKSLHTGFNFLSLVDVVISFLFVLLIMLSSTITSSIIYAIFLIAYLAIVRSKFSALIRQIKTSLH